MVGAQDWDALEAFSVDQFFVDRSAAAEAVVETCRTFPHASVQYIVLALASTASVLKAEWQSGSYGEQTKLLEIHEAIIGLSIDLAALELTGSQATLCKDLLAQWAVSHDEMFLV